MASDVVAVPCSALLPYRSGKKKSLSGKLLLLLLRGVCLPWEEEEGLKRGRVLGRDSPIKRQSSPL